MLRNVSFYIRKVLNRNDWVHSYDIFSDLYLTYTVHFEQKLPRIQTISISYMAMLTGLIYELIFAM